MKLVPIKYTSPTPSMGRGSIEAATAGARGVAATAGAIQDIAVMAAQKYRSFQVENSTAELELELSRWKKQHSTKEFYDSTEVSNLEGVRLTEDIVDSKGEIQTVPRHQIPAYEVQTQLYDRYARNLIKSKGSGIETSSDRGAWESKMEVVLNNQTAQNQIRSIGMMDKANTERAMQNFDNAMDSQNYSAAIGIINAANIPSEKKVEMRHTVNEREERDALDNVLVENNRRDLERGLTVLTDEKEYDSNSGNLSDKERLQYSRSFRVALNALDAKASAAQIAAANKTNRDGRRMISALKTVYGNKISPMVKQNMMTKLEALGDKGAAVLSDLLLADNTQVARQAFLQGSPMERAQALKDLEDKLTQEGGGSPEQILMYEAFREAHEEATISQNKDPLQFAIDQGKVETLPLPKGQNGKLDFMDQSDWAEGRIADRDATQAHFPGKVPLFTVPEVKAMVEEVEDMTSGQKVKLVTDVNEAFGMDAAKDVFTQLSMEKESGAWAHIGTIDDPMTQKFILRGNEIRKEHKGIIQNKTQDFLPEIISRIGGTTAYFNVNNRASVESAILDAYAYLADRDSEWDEPYDEKRMDEAVGMATNGGLMEVNDIIVQRPSRDVDSDDFEDWLDDLSPDYVAQLGGVEGYQDQDIVDYIRGGRIKLMSHGPNQYMLRDMKTHQMLMVPGTNAFFEFKYEKDAPKVQRQSYRGRGSRVR